MPLAFIEAMEYAALDPSEGLLMAPAIAVPRLLDRVGLRLKDIDLIEIHEAFAAQVLANAAAWEKGWKGPATDPVNWDRVNVNGSSIAVGHPWSATGGRIVTTLAYEMARRDARYGLISMCAAGAMGGLFFSLGSDEILGALGGLVADGSLSAAVEQVYPIEQFKEAFERSLKSNRSGKTLFKFGNDQGLLAAVSTR